MEMLRKLVLYLIKPFEDEVLVFIAFSFSTFIQAIKKFVLKITDLGNKENWIEAILVLTFTAGIFHLFDMFTAIMAAKKEGENIKSNKITLTTIKLVATLLVSILLFVFISIFGINDMTSIIVYGLYLLYILREFQSIGENLERRFGYKFVLFDLIDKIAKLINDYLFETLGNIFKKK